MNFSHTKAWIIAVQLLLLTAVVAKGQDTLPRFTVEDRGAGRVVVSWSNPYSNLVQVAVQRSYDSLKRFSTVYSAPSPELPVNGFADKVPAGLKVYYRIFYVMKGGTYYFTGSRRPGAGNTIGAMEYDSRRDLLSESLIKELSSKMPDSVAPEPIFVQTKSGLLSLMPEQFKVFRDSIMTLTNDTLIQTSADTVMVAPYQPPFVQRASQFVYTDKDGYIVIKLPDAASKKYELIFLEEDDTPVFELKNLKESQYTLDKTNFYHGGWYKFELIENGRIKERNRIFLPKDF
jgi:hypothetical protein